MNKLSTNLIKLRTKKSLSVRALSQKLNIPYTTYKNYETGGEPRVDTLIQIADFFSISVDDLIGHTVNQYDHLKQWLLSMYDITIDDSTESIAIDFPANGDYENRMRITVPNKQLFTTLVKIVKGDVFNALSSDITHAVHLELNSIHNIILTGTFNETALQRHGEYIEEVEDIVANASATIPEDVLDIIKERLNYYSKLVSKLEETKQVPQEKQNKSPLQE